MVYNLTNISTPGDMVVTANNLTNGYFGTIIATTIFVISLMYLSTGERPFGYAFATSAWITTLLTIMLRVIGIVPDWFTYITIIMAIGGVAYVVFSKPR